MRYLFDGTIPRIPVGVNIHNAHKDRNHQSAVVEIFVLIDFFDNNDFTIGRCHDYFLGVLPEKTDRTTEEVHH